jgi:hypothetical protein
VKLQVADHISRLELRMLITSKRDRASSAGQLAMVSSRLRFFNFLSQLDLQAFLNGGVRCAECFHGNRRWGGYLRLGDVRRPDMRTPPELPFLRWPVWLADCSDCAFDFDMEHRILFIATERMRRLLTRFRWRRSKKIQKRTGQEVQFPLDPEATGKQVRGVANPPHLPDSRVYAAL